MLDLAIHIVETKKGKFEPQKFEDQYEDALKDLIRKKQKGEKIERPKEPQRSNVVNLMDALKKSVAADKRRAATGEKRQEADRRAARNVAADFWQEGQGSRKARGTDGNATEKGRLGCFGRFSMSATSPPVE